MPMDGYEKLANAIIEQAAKDYRFASRKLRKDPYHPTSLGTVREVEKFFQSEWFKTLTTADGETILNMLKEECGI